MFVCPRPLHVNQVDLIEMDLPCLVSCVSAGPLWWACVEKTTKSGRRGDGSFRYTEELVCSSLYSRFRKDCNISPFAASGCRHLLQTCDVVMQLQCSCNAVVMQLQCIVANNRLNWLVAWFVELCLFACVCLLSGRK